MRALALVFTMLCLWAPVPAEANPLCRWIGLCFYMSPGFNLLVVDAETGTPVPGVYAWAEWVQYGGHGIGGPLMIQDATSSADGQISFPRWGPTFGSRAGLLLGTDPAVILFKPGYTTLMIDNGVAPGASQYESIRGFAQSGRTFRLQSFRGSAAEWVEQLRKLVYPALSSYVSDAERNQFRVLYLRRISVITSELSRLSPDVSEGAKLRASVERSSLFFRGEGP
jgi:hypothetical protein